MKTFQSLLLNLQSNDHNLLILFLKSITQICSLHKGRNICKMGEMMKSSEVNRSSFQDWMQ